MSNVYRKFYVNVDILALKLLDTFCGILISDLYHPWPASDPVYNFKCDGRRAVLGVWLI